MWRELYSADGAAMALLTRQLLGALPVLRGQVTRAICQIDVTFLFQPVTQSYSC